MQGTNKEHTNPLAILWNVISVIGTILGLVSFAEDFVNWKNIFLELLEGYRTIVHFPFNFLQIKVNDFIIDYLFIGSLCGGSFYKAISYGVNNGYLRAGKSETGVKIFYFILYLLFWPLGIIITIRQIISKDEDNNEREIKLRFVYWLLTGVLGFLIFLILNATIPDKL